VSVRLCHCDDATGRSGLTLRPPWQLRIPRALGGYLSSDCMGLALACLVRKRKLRGQKPGKASVVVRFRDHGGASSGELSQSDSCKAGAR